MRSGARPVSRAKPSMLTVPEGIPLEQRDCRARSSPDRPRGCGAARSRRRKPERCVAALVVVAVELRGVAVGDPLGEAEGVALGGRRLGDELVAVVGIGTQDAPVAHHEGHPRRMEVIFEELEGPTEVALPAVGVAGEDEIEAPGLGRGEHLAIVSERQTVVPLWATW